MDTNNPNREEITIEVSKNFLNEIKAGDFDHGLSVANMLLSEGPNFTPELLIVLVESIIELSAQAGSEDAKEYLESKWPTLRVAHLKRLKRKLE